MQPRRNYAFHPERAKTRLIQINSSITLFLVRNQTFKGCSFRRARAEVAMPGALILLPL